jgi:hypothetical protein
MKMVECGSGERDISELLEEVNEVLGSTAASPGRSAIPAAHKSDA